MQELSWSALLEAACVIDSRTAEAAGNVRVAELFASQLQPLGFEVQWHAAWPEEGPRGRHLVALRRGRGERRVLLVGHTDTILSPQEAPYRPADAAGRVHGSGVCDMKGGNVVMVQAVREALKHEAARDATLVVLLNCAEETSSPSFVAVARQWATGATACLCFEPSRVTAGGAHEVVVGRKGVVRFDVVCHGRSAHAGNDHHLGVNALRELARKVEMIESLTDPALHLTGNVGFLAAGRVHNQVPEVGRASCEIRAFDPAVLEQACSKARQGLREPSVRSLAGGQSTRLEVSEQMIFPPWPATASSQPLVEWYVKQGREAGLAIEPGRRGGGSDASHVADLTPTLDGLGPVGGLMHNPGEWADVATLPARASLAGGLIVAIGAGQV